MQPAGGALNPFQSMKVEGARVIIKRGAYPEEVHQFASAKEAAGRAAIIDEAFSWIGTPFRNCADIKGLKGGVDCAMLAVRCYIDTGRLAPFDPRPYPPDWMLHRDEERFLGWIQDTLGARQVAAPRLGDVPVWKVGRCFSHCGIVVNAMEAIHAFRPVGFATLSRLDETQRAVKFFDVWDS
jgi:cell wall-associated NlpC family hydrolase